MRAGIVAGAGEMGLATRATTGGGDPEGGVRRVTGNQAAVPDDPAYAWLGEPGSAGDGWRNGWETEGWNMGE